MAPVKPAGGGAPLPSVEEVKKTLDAQDVEALPAGGLCEEPNAATMTCPVVDMAAVANQSHDRIFYSHDRQTALLWRNASTGPLSPSNAVPHGELVCPVQPNASEPICQQEIYVCAADRLNVPAPRVAELTTDLPDPAPTVSNVQVALETALYATARNVDTLIERFAPIAALPNSGVATRTLAAAGGDAAAQTIGRLVSNALFAIGIADMALIGLDAVVGINVDNDTANARYAQLDNQYAWIASCHFFSGDECASGFFSRAGATLQAVTNQIPVLSSLQRSFFSVSNDLQDLAGGNEFRDWFRRWADQSTQYRAQYQIAVQKMHIAYKAIVEDFVVRFTIAIKQQSFDLSLAALLHQIDDRVMPNVRAEFPQYGTNQASFTERTITDWHQYASRNLRREHQNRLFTQGIVTPAQYEVTAAGVVTMLRDVRGLATVMQGPFGEVLRQTANNLRHQRDAMPAASSLEHRRVLDRALAMVLRLQAELATLTQ